MNLKYYDASSPIKYDKPKDIYENDYNAILDCSFDNTHNVYYDEIEYEETYGEEDFKFINRVRVDSIIQYNTGIIPGDDYKTFYFDSEFPIKPENGSKFRWNKNYWLVINTNHYGSMVNSVEVRRCNNVLRYYDSNGVKVYEPCIMDYTLRFANNNEAPPITVGNGEQKVWCQRNLRTENISENDRFLFGTPSQRVAFRVYAGGTKNYMNTYTLDDNSPALTEFYIEHYEINDKYDDIINGFANAYKFEANISILNEINEIKLGDTIKLEAIVKIADELVDNPTLNWIVSNENIATIEDGNKLVAKDIGEIEVSVLLNDSDNTKDSISLNIVENVVVEDYDILLDNEVDYILQGDRVSFKSTLYKNGLPQDNDILIEDVSINVPKENYDFVLLNNKNSFYIQNNKKFMNGFVEIKMSTPNLEKTFIFLLKGVY